MSRATAIEKDAFKTQTDPFNDIVVLDETWDPLLESGLAASWAAATAALPHLQEAEAHGGGSVINISSVAGARFGFSGEACDPLH